MGKMLFVWKMIFIFGEAKTKKKYVQGMTDLAVWPVNVFG